MSELDIYDADQDFLEKVDASQIQYFSKEEVREFLARAESVMKKSTNQLDVPIRNYFSHGVSGREMTAPAGALIMGKIHKYESMNIISKGEVSILSVDGVVRTKAPYTFVSSPGAKRMIYVHEETVWTTLFGTNEKDPEVIQDQFIAKDYEDVYLSSNRELSDALNLIGVTAEELTAVSENTLDMMEFPIAPDSIEIRESAVHGKGIFALKQIARGETIAPARIGNFRTPAGKYANHSSKPNAEMVMRENGDVDLIASMNLTAGSEILTDYFYNFINTRSVRCLA